MGSVLNLVINSIRKFGLNHIVIQNSNNLIIEVSGKRSNLVNFYSFIKNKLPFPVKVILCKHNLRIEIPKWYITKTLASCTSGKVRSVTKQNTLTYSIKLVRSLPDFRSVTLAISKFIVDYDLNDCEEYFKIDLKGLNNYVVNNTSYNIEIRDIVYYLRELSNLSRIKKVKYRYNKHYLEVLFIS